MDKDRLNQNLMIDELHFIPAASWNGNALSQPKVGGYIFLLYGYNPIPCFYP